MTNYVEHLQPELPVNYCHLIYVSVDDTRSAHAMRAALAADWPFLTDTNRELLHELQMVDSTDEEHGDIYLPYTFILDRDRTIHQIYNGWWYTGRPTVDEIRLAFRELMSHREDWVYRPKPR